MAPSPAASMIPWCRSGTPRARVPLEGAGPLWPAHTAYAVKLPRFPHGCGAPEVKSAVETLSPTRVKLVVEVPFEELKPSSTTRTSTSAPRCRSRASARARCRPDHRPARRPGAVLQHAVNEGLQFFRQAAAPRTSAPSAARGRRHRRAARGRPDLEFAVEVDVRPEIELPTSRASLSRSTRSRPRTTTSTSASPPAQRFGTLVAVDRPAENGDFVSLDLVATIGDEEIDRPPASPTRSAAEHARGHRRGTRLA